MANVTTSAIKGQIAGPSGNAAVGTTITIVHVPSGTTKTATVNASGSFSAKGLRVGGPYRIIIDSDNFEDTELTDVFLTIGETYPVNVALEQQEDIETIVVTGRVVNKNYGSNSPSSSFNLKDIQLTPTVNRDIKDVIRVDPRIYINESGSGGDAIQCAGGNPRFNSLADDVYYGNANSHNPDDAAGEFKYALNTLYFQDKFELSDYDVTITAGLRYDWYTSDDTPTHNQNFEDRYGYSNAQNLDGVDLIQPRFGFNWSASDQLEIRGGFGLYSGGNPNVWISNSYSNDGVRNIQDSVRDVQILGADAIAYNGTGRPGYDIPQSFFDDIGSGTADASTNVTDPNFEIPSEWKYSLGLTYVTVDEYVLTADALYTDKQDSAIVRNLADGVVNNAPDGRPVYDSVNHSRNSDFLLTNVTGDDAKSTILSFAVSKEYENGFAFSASYAYSDVKDVHPMTSSVAFSNYHGIAVSDPENPQLAASNYEVPHRFTVNLTYSHEFSVVIKQTSVFLVKPTKPIRMIIHFPVVQEV